MDALAHSLVEGMHTLLMIDYFFLVLLYPLNSAYFPLNNNHILLNLMVNLNLKLDCQNFWAAKMFMELCYVNVKPLLSQINI